MPLEAQTASLVGSITETEFLAKTLSNPINAEILNRLSALNLPQCHLVAGCLFQTVWNLRSIAEPIDQISDYDIFYFDDSDLSWEAEDRAISDIAALFSDLPIQIDVKNQARVHLWYEEKFAQPYPKLTSARDGIDRYLVECTCIGIDILTQELYGPNGLNDAWNGILKINPKNPQPEMFLEKARSYQSRWPMLTIVPPA